MSSDLIYVFSFWLLFLGVGVIFLPLASKVFANFADSGYIFAKILGLAVVSYLAWLSGSLHLLPFATFSTWLIVLFTIAASVFLLIKTWSDFFKQIKNRWKIIVFEEVLFFVAFSFWAYVRAHEPSIHGLEKFMDFGFINSILRTEFFPPKDLWLTPQTINYYYFGHFETALLTKLSGIPPEITFNLMLAALFALTFVGAFSLGLNLFTSFKRIERRVARGGEPHMGAPGLLAEWETRGAAERQDPSPAASLSAILCGLLSAFLVTLGGNLHAVYAFTRGFDKYWYPDATRFIPYTIHEFPSYSWVVADLHGHVLDIPLVLLVIGIIFSLLITRPQKLLLIIYYLLLALLLAVMYMTNVWDGIIYFILGAMVLFYLNLRFTAVSYQKGVRNQELGIRDNNLQFKLGFKIFNFHFPLFIIHYSLFIILVIVGFFLFSLPFTLNFKPFVSGLGLVRDRSPLYMLFILWGFFYFFVASFLIFLWGKKSKHEVLNSKQYQNSKFKIQNCKGLGPSNLFSISNLGFRNLVTTDIFVLLLIAVSTLLILFPEIFYVKDIYPLHYRANTMFKLGYQAFIMLSLSSAYIFMRIVSSIKYQVLSIKRKILYTLYIILSTLLFIPIAIYPYFSIKPYYSGLKTYQGLDGMAWLKKQYLTDYQAISWLRKNVQSQPVILEAVGESYTDYARVSSFTGLPTVLGWPVHEWLWRGSYDEAGRRDAEVRQAYETPSLELTKAFLEKYEVNYVFVGTLERQKYPQADFSKWEKLGKIIFRSGYTQIYKISP